MDDIGVRVGSCGYDYRHPPGFAVERPRGRADWLFLQVATPTAWRKDGVERTISAGCCIVIPPGHAQSYGSDGGAFANHWWHAEGPALRGLIAAVGLPLDDPFPVADAPAIARSILAIDRELKRRAPGWELAAAAGAVQCLVEAARGRARRSGAGDGRLRDVRARMLAAPERPWSVAGLAAAAGLSPSRFSARFRSAFGTSPLEDLIRARIDRACHLLDGGIAVAQAATASGFSDLPYFYRQFRRRCGRTPGAWRGR